MNTAIVSTLSVDARDNAVVTGPVYLVNNDLVATGFTDFWDGTHESSIFLNQFNDVASSVRVWTGTDIYGFGVYAQELGNWDFIAVVGSIFSASGDWVNAGDDETYRSGNIYALSSVIQVASVPVPAAVWLFGSGLIGLVGISRRKKAA